MVAGYSPDGTRSASAGRLLLGLIFLGATAVLAGFIVPDIAPTIRAVQGDGRPGVFTAERLDCTKRCLWYGEFHADAGGPSRPDVWIEGVDRDDLKVGGITRAMDAGAPQNVYTPDGSPHWPGLIGGALLTLAAAVASGHLIRRGVRGLRRVG